MISLQLTTNYQYNFIILDIIVQYGFRNYVSIYLRRRITETTCKTSSGKRRIRLSENKVCLRHRCVIHRKYCALFSLNNGEAFMADYRGGECMY